MPTVCNYYVTLRCNALCEFCNIPQTNNAAPPPEPTLEQLGANLRDLKRLGVRMVDFTGGEPLLYKHIVEAFTLAKELGFFTTLTSNGMLFPKFADRLAGKVDSLLFSIDAPRREEHDRIRGVKSFDRALAAVRAAQDRGQVVYLSHTVTNSSIESLDEMVAFARTLGVILYISPCFAFFGNEGLSPANATRLLPYFERPGLIVDRAQLRLVMAGGNDTRDPVCQAVTSTVVISPDNKLYLPCYHFKRDVPSIDGSLYDLYHSPVVQRAAAMQGRHDFCEGCTVYCYMRSSLVWRYPLDVARMGAHYVKERVRFKLRTLV